MDRREVIYPIRSGVVPAVALDGLSTDATPVTATVALRLALHLVPGVRPVAVRIVRRRRGLVQDHHPVEVEPQRLVVRVPAERLGLVHAHLLHGLEAAQRGHGLRPDGRLRVLAVLLRDLTEALERGDDVALARLFEVLVGGSQALVVFVVQRRHGPPPRPVHRGRGEVLARQPVETVLGGRCRGILDASHAENVERLETLIAVRSADAAELGLADVLSRIGREDVEAGFQHRLDDVATGVAEELDAVQLDVGETLDRGDLLLVGGLRSAHGFNLVLVVM